MKLDVEARFSALHGHWEVAVCFGAGRRHIERHASKAEALARALLEVAEMVRAVPGLAEQLCRAA